MPFSEVKRKCDEAEISRKTQEEMDRAARQQEQSEAGATAGSQRGFQMPLQQLAGGGVPRGSGERRTPAKWKGKLTLTEPPAGISAPAPKLLRAPRRPAASAVGAGTSSSAPSTPARVGAAPGTPARAMGVSAPSTPSRVGRALRAASPTLTAAIAPKISISNHNPHSGEGQLFFERYNDIWAGAKLGNEIAGAERRIVHLESLGHTIDAEDLKQKCIVARACEATTVANILKSPPDQSKLFLLKCETAQLEGRQARLTSPLDQRAAYVVALANQQLKYFEFEAAFDTLALFCRGGSLFRLWPSLSIDISVPVRG